MNLAPADPCRAGAGCAAPPAPDTDRSREWAREWSRDPQWRSLFAPVDAAATLADLKSAALDLLEAAGWFEGLVTQWLSILRAHPFAEPPVRVRGDATRRLILLHDGPTATISASVLPDGIAAPQPGARIIRSGRWSATRFVRAAGVRAERWTSGANDPDRLLRDGDIDVRDGMVVTLDGRTTAQRLVQSTSRAVVMLSISTPLGASPHVHEHDAESGAVLRIATADDGVVRAQMMLRLLRALDMPGASARFEEASRDDQSHLRWEAMREWLLMHRDGALPRLAAMAESDPDPAVRTAARQTLARIGERCHA